MTREAHLAKIKPISKWLKTGSINLFGSPFAGKDIQGRYLADLLGAQLLGGGDILRSSLMPERIKNMMQTGELIPTKDYLEIVIPYLGQAAFADKPLILSSVGRWHGEEPGVIEATVTTGHPLRAVLFLRLLEEEVWRRWGVVQSQNDRGKRGDDTVQALEIRLKEFQNKTLPVIEFYRDRGLLIEVDGSAEPDAVTDEILSRLSELAQAN